MDDVDATLEAAQLFKALSSVSRLTILRILRDGPSSVGALTEASGQSQPLVSQHLKVLRTAGLVAVTRTGREAMYSIADHHVTHVIDDAITHVLETNSSPDPRTNNPLKETIMAEEKLAEHTVVEHEHKSDCGHESVQHDDHVDYVHDGHKHAQHEDHYDEH
ncbi:ArsR/SmtB family transcription factor [Marisediminicola senii]|uniref:ArsR/SmtB family transcription factor n=1 Tax=Marisediminicola senii TaxID=2711233 RepID=UPI001F2872DC|nr:metalloregulator ArsR/SmtB family transcription factor [Marisediminicola senii]